MKWITKDGKKIDIKKMETSHIINAINMLERNAKEGISVGYLDNGYDGDSYVPAYWVEIEVLKGKKYLATTKWKHLKKELSLRNKIITN